ncbi:MAG: hypothetical protein AAF513_05525 [Pseudomonadota bacterium]
MSSPTIARVLAGALALVLQHRKRLSQALLPPFALSMLVVALPTGSGFMGALAMFMTLLIHTMYAVATHRIVLLGGDAVPTWGVTSWSNRESRFTLAFVGLFLGVVACVAFLVGLLGQYAVVGALPMVFVFSSWSLIFPAIAVDEPTTLGGAWELADGFRLLMVMTVSIFPILLVVPSLLLLASEIEILHILAPLLEVISTVLTVTALSVAYGELRKVKGGA